MKRWDLELTFNSSTDSFECPLRPYNKDTLKRKVGWAQHGLSKWVLLLAHILT